MNSAEKLTTTETVIISNEQLMLKFDQLRYWFDNTGDMGNTVDLVCAQCEAEELVEIIKAARQQLKEAQK